MLEIQKYLRDNDTDLDVAADVKGLNLAVHPTLGMIIVNYDQLNSRKTCPIARQCRSLVLDGEYNLVSKSFDRFFNLGEMVNEVDNFDWSNFIVQEKLDGSLVGIHYSHGQWHVRTRASWAEGLMQFQDFTWFEGILKAIDCTPDEFQKDCNRYLDQKLTYVCEFCSPWNQVVRRFELPYLYLLTAFEGEQEIGWDDLDYPEFFWEPRRYQFSSLQEIEEFITKQGEEDKTWEGVVVRDRNNERWKIKSPTYLALHRLRGEGDNLYNPKNLVPLILAGDTEEVITYFPSVQPHIQRLKSQLDADYAQLVKIWLEHWQIESQKEFALTIMGRTPYTSILFNMRKKYGKDQSILQLGDEWRNSGDLLIKAYKENNHAMVT